LGVTRRLFLYAAAARPVVVEAIAAEKMPQRLVLSGIAPAPYFELRQYEFLKAPPLWKDHGLRPVWSKNGRFLFSFESLGAREQAWRSLSGDPNWPGAQVSELSLWRTRWYYKNLSS
jgi:hypothetical protein